MAKKGNQTTFRSGDGRPKGRPKGAKNKRTNEIEELAREMIGNREYLDSLRVRLIAGTAQHMEKFFAEHRYGVPKKTVALEGDVPPFVLMIDEPDSD
jgi:hypothetical protein